MVEFRKGGTLVDSVSAEFEFLCVIRGVANHESLLTPNTLSLGP